MGSPCLQRCGGNEEPRHGREHLGGVRRGQLLQPQRTRHLSVSFPRWVLALALAAIAAGEWLRVPSRPAALAALLLLLLAGVLLALRRVGLWSLLPLGITLLLLGASEWRIERVQRAWGGAHGEREARIEGASGRLQKELRRAGNLADSLAH